MGSLVLLAVCGLYSKAHRSQKARFATQTKDRSHDTKPRILSATQRRPTPNSPTYIKMRPRKEERVDGVCAPS